MYLNQKLLLPVKLIPAQNSRLLQDYLPDKAVEFLTDVNSITLQPFPELFEKRKYYSGEVSEAKLRSTLKNQI